MESRKFDDLTRVFATGVSRRSAIRGLISALAGTSAVVGGSQSANAACGEVDESCDPIDGCCQGLICVAGTCRVDCNDIGASCESDDECCTGPCDADSGTCCTHGGASCNFDEDCCGILICWGVCCVAEGDVCTEFECCSGLSCNGFTCQPQGCFENDSSCSEDSECCSLNCDRLTGSCCVRAGQTCNGGGCCGELTCGLEGKCCFPEGSDCGDDTDCCDDLVCTGQLCTAACLASNVMNPECSTTTPDCCDANAIYNPNNCECRVLCANGVSCFTDDHCQSDEFCSSGCCTPCQADGEGVYCATDQACCSGNCELNNCGCRSIQTDCTDDSQCCSGICSDVEPRVCLPPEASCANYGEECELDSDCCNDDPRFEASCAGDACTACHVTDAIPGRCAPGSQTTLPCCDIEATWNDQTCRCEIACHGNGADCYDNNDCCADLVCVYGTCGHHPSCGMEKSPCDDKTPCCKGYTCYDGYCRPPQDQPDDSDSASVNSLPSTGAGPGEDDAGSIGALLAGGAAAAMAVWLKKSESGQMSEAAEES